MFEKLRFMINDLNQFKYLNNINRVNVRPTIANENTNNMSDINYSELKELEKLETTQKINNLKIYASNNFKIRTRRFFVISLPAALAAITICSYFTPGKIKEKNLDKYSYETVHIDTEKGEIKEQENVYCKCIGKPVDNSVKFVDGINSEMVFRITDGVNTITASYDINSDDIKPTSANTDVYMEQKDYKKDDYKEVEDKYSEIYDKIILDLKNSRYLSEDDVKLLEQINESDKKRIIIDIKKYTDVEDDDLIKYKTSAWPRNLLLSFVTFLYTIIMTLAVSEEGLHRGAYLGHISGEMYESNVYDGKENIFFGPTKYKEAYIAAEKLRIKRAKELACNNLEEPFEIFTGFEKKLIKKDMKNTKKDN